MSHVPDQPYEVPFRTVDHDEETERIDEDGRDMILGIGRIDGEDWWGTTTDWKTARKDLLRRQRARRDLGGFGFRSR